MCAPVGVTEKVRDSRRKRERGNTNPASKLLLYLSIANISTLSFDQII